MNWSLSDLYECSEEHVLAITEMIEKENEEYKKRHPEEFEDEED